MNHRSRFSHSHRLGLPRSCCGEKSLLTEGIFTSNIDTSTPGNIRIALWHEWRPMLEGLSGIGPVWHMIRNGHAVLAAQGDYPTLTFSADERAAGTLHGHESLVASVISEGLTQTCRIQVERAMEKQGWLVFSGEGRALYAESEPTGFLSASRKSIDGESVWTLSLHHPEKGHLLHLHGDIDHCAVWNQLMQELML